MEIPAHICILKAPKEEGFLAAFEVTALCLQVQTADWSTGDQTVDDALCSTLRGISLRMTMSQAVHHGQKVVSFAAGTGRLISRLCKLSHDLCQLCIGLLVLKDNVIHQSQYQSDYHSD